MRTITLTDGIAEVVIVPEMGAGVASFDFVAGGRRDSLFRPCRAVSGATPFELACNLLVPWSNRISGGGFHFGGRFHSLPPNLLGEPLPIHGNGFSSKWEAVDGSKVSAVLALNSDGPGPYRFAAEVRYNLAGGALRIALSVANRGDEALPFGLGLHPWFPRTPGVTLKAPAETVTLEGPLHLPAAQILTREREEWDFSIARRLPSGWINNDFASWNGRAEIAWADRGLRLLIDTDGDPILNKYIVYSPSPDAQFFCFEPVTHLVDAHNRPGGPVANGLTILKGGEELAISCRFIAVKREAGR